MSKLELKRLFAGQINRWSLLLFLLMGIAAIVSGAQSYKSLVISQYKAVKVFEYEREYVKDKEQLPEAGSLGYYAKAPTRWQLDPWAALFQGQSQAYLATIKVNLLALQGQIYNREILNPSRQKAGGFDLGFVLVYLLPILIGVLCVNLLADEREAGRWSLLKATALGGRGLLWRRFYYRIVLVLALQAALLALAFTLLGLWTSPKLLAVVGWLLLYNVFWFLLAALIVALGRNMVFSSLAFIGSWLLMALLIPGLVQIYLGWAHQPGGDLQASLGQRMAMNDSWDGDQQQQLNQFLQSHKEFSDTQPLLGKFHWKWYYAAQHLSDQTVDDQWQAYVSVNRQRAQALARISWLSPSLTLQYRLNHLAGTDGAAYLDYQLQVADYHRQLREFFYPLLFEKQAFDRTVIDSFPMFKPAARSGLASWLGLAVSSMLLILLATLVSRRYRRIDRV